MMRCGSKGSLDPSPAQACSGGPDDARDLTRALTRGALRWLVASGYAPLIEVPLTNARRVDVVGFNERGHCLVIEIKSGRGDFLADHKWPDYLPYCDGFYFAVAAEFPLELLPLEAGILVADGFGAVIRRPAPPQVMNGNARRKLLLRFARLASLRWHRLIDPAGQGLGL